MTKYITIKLTESEAIHLYQHLSMDLDFGWEGTDGADASNEEDPNFIKSHNQSERILEKIEAQLHTQSTNVSI